MSDPRLTKFARLIVQYSVEIKPGNRLLLETDPLAVDLTLAVLEEAVKAGAHPFILNSVPGADEIFYKYASEAQLNDLDPVKKMLIETFDSRIVIRAPENTRALSGIEPGRMARYKKANAETFKIFNDRSARNEMKWNLTVYPNNALAQDADMSLNDYREFVFKACKLNEKDPVASWQKEGERQRRWTEWMKGRDRVVLKGPDVDLTLSIKERSFMPSEGKLNLPDGEIFTGPVEDSAQGWIRFKYPSVEYEQEVSDIKLWFEGGKVVKERAGKNEDLLTSLLNTDAGSRYIGEWGIGTNYDIQIFTKNILFDEKMGGTIHLAVGAGYPETGSTNESGIHWDLLCDMNEAEITIDGDLFYKNGKPVV